MEKYIGIPYSFRDYNCWHHVKAVRSDFGIKTKMFQPRTMRDAFKLITAQMSIIDNGLSLVDKPQNFDIVIVEKLHGKRMVYHCGVYYDGYVNHCDNVFGSVRHQSFNEFKQGYTGVSFWR